jgi:hypothetical protein
MREEENYPKDFQEFLAKFPDETSCWLYLMEIRWKDGYIVTNVNRNDTG